MFAMRSPTFNPLLLRPTPLLHSGPINSKPGFQRLGPKPGVAPGSSLSPTPHTQFIINPLAVSSKHTQN